MTVVTVDHESPWTLLHALNENGTVEFGLNYDARRNSSSSLATLVYIDNDRINIYDRLLE